MPAIESPLPVVGQLYMIRTSAAFKSDDCTERCEFIVHASNQDDAVNRVYWAVDRSKYRSFRVTKVTKIRHIHRVSSRLIPEEALQEFPASLHIEQPEVFSVSGPSQRTNQIATSMFAVGIGGKSVGRDADQVLRKLGEYLIRLGIGQDCKNPLVEGGVIRVEQEGPVDSTVTTASHLKRMDATHFHHQRPLPGGAPGSKR